MASLSPAPGWLGVLGGLGPLASAEFVKTIYEEGIDGIEQRSPRVRLVSDPTFPDRTTAFLAGEEEEIRRRLVDALSDLRAQGAARVVICCVTMHHLMPRLPADLQALVVSLLDVAAAAVSRSRESHLLLCTTGTRRLRLFERHPRWTDIRDRVILPSDEDQEAVHDMIYRIKANEPVDALLPVLKGLLDKYGVASFIVGCTEMHFFAKRQLRDGARCIDPLFLIARDLSALLSEPASAEARVSRG